MTTPATPQNMRLAARAFTAFAWSPTTGEQYSADAGDYFALRDDEPLTDSNGDSMILVYTQTIYRDALTGEVLHA